MTTQYLLNEQLDRVLAALMPSNRLVCQVCLQTGLRVSDVLRLRPEDIRPNIWVTESKTGKRRQVGFPRPLAEAILVQASTAWAFPSPKDATKPRTRQAVWADVKRAARAFRLPQNVGVHSMRKVYAVELLHKYGDIKRVRRALNHSHYTTTMLYAMADRLLETAPKHRKRSNAT